MYPTISRNSDVHNYWGPAGGGGGPMSPIWFLKRLVSVFISACRLLSALPSLLQFGRGRLSLVAISFYALSLLFGPCRLSEFTRAGPHYSFVFYAGYLFSILLTTMLSGLLASTTLLHWMFISQSSFTSPFSQNTFFYMFIPLFLSFKLV